MGKFEVEFEIQGLKLRMKGEREDIPVIAHNIGKQVENLIKPAAMIAENKSQLPLPIGSQVIDVAAATARRRRPSKSPAKQDSSSEQPQAEITIDAQTWGTPTQKWKGLDKAIWLLYVVGNSGGPNELTSAQITSMFNTKFREAGTIMRQNINRDLTKVKGAEGLVGRNEQNDAWFLTDAGKKRATELITKARETPSAPAN